MQKIKNAVKRALKYKYLYSGIMPIKTPKKEYNKLKSFYENLSNSIAEEIISRSNGSSFVEKKERLPVNNYNVLSAVGDFVGSVIEIDGVIYRGVTKEGLQNFKELYEMGFYQTLIKHHLLCPFELTNFVSFDYPIILKPKQLIVVPPTFWNSYTLSKASIKISLIQSICKKCDVMFYDGHVYNVSSFNGQLLYFDLGSFLYVNKLKTTNNDFSNAVNLYTLIFRQFNNSSLKNIGFDSTYFNLINSKDFINSIEVDHIFRSFVNFHKTRSKHYVARIINQNFKHHLIKPEDVDVLFFKTLHKRDIGNSKYQVEINNLYETITYIGTDCSMLYKISLLPNLKRLIVLSNDDGVSNRLQEKVEEKGIDCEFYCVNPFYETPDSIKKAIISDLIVTDDTMCQYFTSFKAEIIYDHLLSIGKELIIYKPMKVDNKKTVNENIVTKRINENYILLRKNI